MTGKWQGLNTLAKAFSFDALEQATEQRKKSLSTSIADIRHGQNGRERASRAEWQRVQGFEAQYPRALRRSLQQKINPAVKRELAPVKMFQNQEEVMRTLERHEAQQRAQSRARERVRE